MLCRDCLGVAVINHLIDDLVNQHKVLPNALFVQHSTVVSEDLHHSVQDIEHITGLDVVTRGGHKVNSKLLREEVVDSIDILQ